ncbi:MAG TPA: DNA repair protein RadC [Bacteroidia bacterium]|nr:DNA repair protein RadC [Bacteroidia bacterium]
METSGIKTWAEADRPREKLLKLGRHNLTDSELLAILIRTGTKELTAVDVAKKILSDCNNDITQLSKLSVNDLMKNHKGMGEVKAITIVAALELGRRRREAEGLKKEKISSSRDAFEILQPRMADLVHEEFVVLMLNRANDVIGKYDLSKGGIAGTVVDPKLIFKAALEYLACGIILCHNHPSGNPKPSPEDLKLTKKLKDAGTMMEIDVLDHIIVAGDGYFSFADEGLI